jgi:aspartate/methionine/tyrosine aminotransferase
VKTTARQIAQRAEAISPFHVMDILAQAQQLERQGQDIIHMEVGEPDFTTPAPIIEAGMRALQQGMTHYTPALGLPDLRDKIADWYQQRYGVTISASRVVVTPGASGALLLVMGALLEQGKQVLLADPGYPCNRHFARFVEGRAKSVPVSEKTNYQLDANLLAQHWTDETQLALVASPSNPTGTVLSRQQLCELATAVRQRNGFLVVDEIYHGLTYDQQQACSVLEVDDAAFVVNSFSKFFGMTGWRLGWLIVPEAYVEVMDKLAQNLYLAPPTVAQYAALAAFEPQTLAELESRRQLFEQRRNALLPALRELGFHIPITPQGAFYLYANCSAFLDEATPDSMALSPRLLHEAGVAITPGLDFGEFDAAQHCRFAYTTDTERLLEAVSRMKKCLVK